MTKSSGKYRWALKRLREWLFVHADGVCYRIMTDDENIWWRKRAWTIGGRWSHWKIFCDNETQDWNRKFKRHGNPTFYLTEAEAAK